MSGVCLIFYSQWCKPSVLDLWTLFGLDSIKSALRNRTNYALERYNRHFNNLFPNAHPTLLLFANVLFDEGSGWIDLMRDKLDVSSVVEEYLSLILRIFQLTMSISN